MGKASLTGYEWIDCGVWNRLVPDGNISGANESLHRVTFKE
jgi:hypothetical protein